MNCRRSEELWSDFLDGALAPPLERDLRAHLDSCEECTSLFAAFRDVVNELGALPVPAMPEGLTERIRARRRASFAEAERVEIRFAAPPPRLVAAASWLAAAAVFVLVVLWRPPEIVSEWSSRTSQSAHQVYSFGVRTYHQTERWLEDLNVLRMTVGVAFEDQLDQLNERLRSLEEAGRKSREGDDEQSRDHDAPADAHSARSTSSSPRERVGEVQPMPGPTAQLTGTADPLPGQHV